MPRNFLRRIEVVFPIEDGNLRERLLAEIFATILADNQKARFLQAGGSYQRLPLKREALRRRSQTEFIARAVSENHGSEPARKGAGKYPRMKLASKPSRANR